MFFIFGTWHVSFAEEFLMLQEVSIEFKHFMGDSRNALLTYNADKQLTNEVNLNFNVDILKFFYWNNTVHSQTDQSQFRLVGWKFDFGVRLHDHIDLQYSHFSRHLLDAQWSHKFPVEDSIGFKFYLYR